MMTKRATRGLQVLGEGHRSNMAGDTVTGSPMTVNMSIISNATSYIDKRGVGHVKTNNRTDWSNVLVNGSTVHILHNGSGPNSEILIVPITHVPEVKNHTGENNRNTTSGSGSEVDSANSASGGSMDDSTEVVTYVGTDSTILVIVGSVLAFIAVVTVLAVVVYGRRIRRRAGSFNEEPFIVGSLPQQPVPPQNMLDTDMTPDFWVEGQYQYSPNVSRLQESLDGTAILSDHNTTSSNHRFTVDAYPSSRRGYRRNNRADTERDQSQQGTRSHTDYANRMRPTGSRRGYTSRRENAPRRDPSVLDDISDRGRRREGTTPIVLYEEESMEENKTSSNRKQLPTRSLSPSQQPQRQRPQEQQHRRREKYRSRRDR
ncbi:hypothetical protein PsorP6_002109 [Peronosclerospora sorghi]|uniref:Uncharacterized protein n=1 Tax=Peronosclerospora sorghi TaxID=230839 RepID=A0ACC0WU37_9STRA|nr:hypothetical protein PsorP6_002109 [Peronosclerospora sorghi]